MTEKLCKDALSVVILRSADGFVAAVSNLAFHYLLGVPIAVIQTFLGVRCSHARWPIEMGWPVYVPLEAI